VPRACRTYAVAGTPFSAEARQTKVAEAVSFRVKGVTTAFFPCPSLSSTATVSITETPALAAPPAAGFDAFLPVAAGETGALLDEEECGKQLRRTQGKLVAAGSQELGVSEHCSDLAQRMVSCALRIDRLRLERDQLRGLLRRARANVQSHAADAAESDEAATLLHCRLSDPRHRARVLLEALAAQQAQVQALSHERQRLRDEIITLGEKLTYEGDVITSARVARDALISVLEQDEAFAENDEVANHGYMAASHLGGQQRAELFCALLVALRLHITDLEAVLGEWPEELPEPPAPEVICKDLTAEVQSLLVESEAAQLEGARLRELLRSRELELDAACGEAHCPKSRSSQSSCSLAFEVSRHHAADSHSRRGKAVAAAAAAAGERRKSAAFIFVAPA